MTEHPTPAPGSVAMTDSSVRWLRNIINNGGSILTKDGPRSDLRRRMINARLIEERFPGRLHITDFARSALSEAGHDR